MIVRMRVSHSCATMLCGPLADARMEVDTFASSLEIKKAHMRLALELHPDKQPTDISPEALEIVKKRFHEMVEAYGILSEPATRREYDKQRDHLDANNEAGVANDVDFGKPPPTCEDAEATLEQIYTGCRLELTFRRNEFKGTQWHKVTHGGWRSLKVNRGEAEGTTYWFRGEGDVGPFGSVCLASRTRAAHSCSNPWLSHGRYVPHRLGGTAVLATWPPPWCGGLPTWLHCARLWLAQGQTWSMC